MTISDIITKTEGLKLLYVEDNDETREATLCFLENLFDDILIAKDGLDGLNKFKENQDIDIIISDINMPKIDGLKMAKEILEINQDIPILIFSAHNDSKYFIDAIKIGVEGYLLKPLDTEQFIQALNKAMKKIYYEKNKNEIYKLKQEKEQIKFAFDIVKNISHHWKQPLTIISTISSGCILKRELGLEFTDDDYNNIAIITKEALELSKVLGELEKLDFDSISMEEISNIIHISNPIYENEKRMVK